MKSLNTIILFIQLVTLTKLHGQEIVETKTIKQTQEYSAEHFVAKVSDILIKGGNIYLIDQGLTAIIKTDSEA